MTRISRLPVRRHKGAKRVDFTPLREMLEDDRCWVAFGQVFKPDDAPSHFRIVEEGGVPVEVLVEVLTIGKRAKDLTCSLAPAGGGLWIIPEPGTEVIVAIPDGEAEHFPTIVGIRPSGEVHPRVSAERAVLVSALALEIIAPSVRIFDGSGTTKALATKEDVDALAAWIKDHMTLPVTGGTAGPGAGGTPGAPTAVGTTVLKAN